jgi:hypothetical protein
MASKTTRPLDSLRSVLAFMLIKWTVLFLILFAQCQLREVQEIPAGLC